MHEINTKAILISKINYKDKSDILHFYTAENGIVSFIAYKKQKIYKYPLLSLLQLNFTYKEKRNIQYIKDFININNSLNIILNNKKIAISLFIADLIDKTVKEQEKNEKKFDFLHKIILKLTEIKDDYLQIFFCFFLVKFSSLLGFEMTNNYADNTYFDMTEGEFVNEINEHQFFFNIEQSKTLSKILSLNIDTLELSQFGSIDFKEVLKVIFIYYNLHITGFNSIKSIDFINEIL